MSNPLNVAILHLHGRVKAFGDNLGNQTPLVYFRLFNLRLNIGDEDIEFFLLCLDALDNTELNRIRSNRNLISTRLI